MKKILSVILAAAILLGTVSYTVTASSDTCIRVSDTTGSTGYSAGTGAVNTYAVQNDGATLIFDVKLESVSNPPSGFTSRLFVFSGASDYNYAGYDFTNGAFKAGEGTAWPTESHADNFNAYSTRPFTWNQGQWYEIAYQFDGNVVTVYIDGVPMVSAEVADSFNTEYLILYPQYCTVLIDNLRVCGKDYNVRDRFGEVYAATDFTGVTTPASTACWTFDGAGYSVSAAGRPMPELSEMLPERTVSPNISGSHLKYAEAGGSGVAATGIDFTPYGGFTVIEDIRVDRKSALGNFSVRFGTNYIAGYDFDNGCFRISQRSGYSFSSSAEQTFAKTEYTLNLKETYEFAVQQTGNVVSVYLNGVLMVQAQNDNFASGYSNVDVSCYRIGAVIDNFVVAYPDYNVREATGSVAAKFTFDESVDYINGIWKFALGSGSNGYSIATQAGGFAPVVAGATAESGKATVGISLSGCENVTGFELSVSYPASMSVATMAASSRLSGTSVLSQTTKNPVVMTYADAMGTAVTDGQVMSVTFNAPSAAGNYTVNATVTPYFGDIPGAPITASGVVTVPEEGVPVGRPAGIAYDGETITWEADPESLGYEIYYLYDGDDYEEYIDFTEDCSYSFPYEDYIPDPGVYILRVYMYNEEAEIAGVSDSLKVLVCEDGTVYGGVKAYADAFYGKLAAYVAGNTYSSSNLATVNSYLEDAEYSFAAAEDFAEVDSLYADYKLFIESVPTGGGSDVIIGDLNDSGTFDVADRSLFARYLKGSDVTINISAADMDGNGTVTVADLSVMTKALKS